jgi:hypothetical protein
MVEIKIGPNPSSLGKESFFPTIKDVDVDDSALGFLRIGQFGYQRIEGNIL